MLKQAIKYIAIFLLSGIYQPSIADPLVSLRIWQFHELDMAYVLKAMKRASDYNINTVVFSHGMIGEVSQLYDGSTRGNQLRKLANEAHALNLKVWIWIHELEFDVPTKYFEKNVVQMDKKGFWDWLKRKYEKLFNDYPEFDGIILTFHETEYKIFKEKEVISKLPMPERFAKMINTINDLCQKYKKDFVVRSFLYEPQEMKWFRQGLQKVSKRVMLQSKAVPHDWQPFYPHNPMIGKFPDRKLIVEFDCSSEFTGKNRIPYASPEYFEYRWRYDLKQPGVVGYNARLDHGGYDALFTPNEINIYTLYRLTEDEKVIAKDIWEEWTALHYGEKAAKQVELALRPSFEIVNKSFFVHKFWITNHSQLPSFGYAESHISSRTIAKWIVEQCHYQQMEERLKHPDPILLETILAEKDTAIALSEEALQYLHQVKPFLTSEQYDDLYWRLALLHRTALIWKLHAEAFFGYKITAEGHQVVGLKERVRRAVNALYREADVSEKSPYIVDFPPASAAEIRKVAAELEVMINMRRTVRNTILHEIGNIPIEDIELEGKSEDAVYEVTVKPDGNKEVKLFINQKGQLVEKREELDLSELPDAIINHIQNRINRQEIESSEVWKQYQGGSIFYEIEIETRNGDYKFKVNERVIL